MPAMSLNPVNRRVSAGAGKDQPAVARGGLLRAFAGPLLILAAVLVANLAYLSGAFNDNPMVQSSGLATDVKPGVLSGRNSIDPNQGITLQALGHASARTVLQGRSPWWNYNEGVGAPLAGEMQGATLFLPFVLLLGLTNGVLLLHVLLELLAGLATYYLLRRLRCSEVAGALGGVLFAVNGTYAWLGNAVVTPIAFLPLLLCGVESVYVTVEQARTRRPWWILIAVALALSLYAGFPEVAFLDALLAALWASVRALQLRRGPWAAFCLQAGLGVLVGVLFAGPVLVAFTGYLPYADVGIHTAISPSAALHASGFPGLLMPYLFGQVFGQHTFDATGALGLWWGNVGGFLSPAVVVLALFALWVPGRNRSLALALAAWTLLSVARVYGLAPAGQLLNLIPGVSKVAAYRYLQPSFELAVVILAALGLDRLHREAAPVLWLAVGVGLVSCLLVALLVQGRAQERLLATAPHHAAWFLLAGGWALASVVAILVLRALGPRRWLILVVGLVGADALVMFVVPELSAPRAAHIDVQPVVFLQQHLGTRRYFSVGPIAPNYGSYFDIAGINTSDLPVPATWSRFVTASLNPNADGLTFDGLQLRDPAGVNPLAAFLAHVPAYEEMGVGYVVAQAGEIPAGPATTAGLVRVFSDPLADIFALPAPQPYFQVTAGDCQQSALDKATITVDCTTAATLLRRELFMPGWQAVIDGRAVPVRASGPLFQQVALESGRSTVVFRYAPPGLGYAQAGVLLGLIAVLVSCFTAGLPGPRRRTGTD